jgi:hypothetical protein
LALAIPAKTEIIAAPTVRNNGVNFMVREPPC